MQRVCFCLQVKKDRLDEYKARHREVWPEMRQALHDTGWRNYSLYIRDDGLLVGYLETDDFDQARARMAALEVNTRWQAEMRPFFEGIPGRRPDELMLRLEEVFHLD
ncbi:MAG: L-rhamnose mutarotase [Bryobacter sp.]